MPTQPQYKDRTDAGQQLAERLAPYSDRKDVLVLGLPRGGVPVAYEVAKALNVPLDVYLVRKLGAPGQEELAMGAIATGGVMLLNHDVIRELGITDEMTRAISMREWQELARREGLYRGARPLPEVAGKTVILVDDGLATGFTMRAAIAALKKQAPAHIVVAVPVAAAQTAAELAAEVDEVVCLYTPNMFYAVGLWYGDFRPVTDEQVHALLHVGGAVDA
ncbi:MAG: phosphoribosyltransferase [Chloroflexota bacterium]